MKISKKVAIELLRSRADIPADKDSVSYRHGLISAKSACLDMHAAAGCVFICVTRGKHSQHEDVEGGIWWS